MNFWEGWNMGDVRVRSCVFCMRARPLPYTTTASRRTRLRFAQDDSLRRAEGQRTGENPRRVPQFCGMPSHDGTRGDGTEGDAAYNGRKRMLGWLEQGTHDPLVVGTTICTTPNDGERAARPTITAMAERSGAIPKLQASRPTIRSSAVIDRRYSAPSGLNLETGLSVR